MIDDPDTIKKNLLEFIRLCGIVDITLMAKFLRHHMFSFPASVSILMDLEREGLITIDENSNFSIVKKSFKLV